MSAQNSTISSQQIYDNLVKYYDYIYGNHRECNNIVEFMQLDKKKTLNEIIKDLEAVLHDNYLNNIRFVYVYIYYLLNVYKVIPIKDTTNFYTSAKIDNNFLRDSILYILRRDIKNNDITIDEIDECIKNTFIDRKEESQKIKILKYEFELISTNNEIKCITKHIINNDTETEEIKIKEFEKHSYLDKLIAKYVSLSIRCDESKQREFLEIVFLDDIEKFRLQFNEIDLLSIHDFYQDYSLPYFRNRSNERFTFIEFVTVCGAIDCFKYIYMKDKDLTLSNSSFESVVYSRNLEMIHLYMQQSVYEYDNNKLFKTILFNHDYDMLYWFAIHESEYYRRLYFNITNNSKLITS